MVWIAVYGLTGLTVGQSLSDNMFPRAFDAPAWGALWALAWPVLWVVGSSGDEG